jgi:hypothetical protein
MNALIVGTRKDVLLDYLPDRYLLIDDGPLIDQIELAPRKAVTQFALSKHSFNPLKDMSYKRARDFISVLDAVFPEGENTLTRKNSNFILLGALLTKPKNISSILVPNPRDAAHTDAYQKIETLLFSPVLSSVLSKPTSVSFKGTIHVRLDRAVIGDFDAFVIANLLISQYDGPVVISDFGFYACRPHSALLRQNRLVASVNSFDEASGFKQQLLLIDTKIGSHCTAQDAELLALYAGLTPGTNAFTSYVHHAIL